MKKDIIKIHSSRLMIWPHSCVLCLEPATHSYRVLEMKGLDDEVPYCEACYIKVRRLINWKDGIFMIALFFGGIAALIGLVAAIIDDWLNLLRIITYISLIFVGIAAMGVFYLLGYFFLGPIRIVFHNKLSAAGVYRVKHKDPSILQLKFSNLDYARLFKEENGFNDIGE